MSIESLTNYNNYANIIIRKCTTIFLRHCCGLRWPEATYAIPGNGTPLSKFGMWYIDNKKMKQKVLSSAAKMFSNFWIKSQNNPKLYGFSEDAEICRDRLDAYILGKYLTTAAFLTGLVVALMFMFQNQNRELVILSSVLGILGFVMIIILVTFYKPGNTRTQIAKEWAPVRRKLLKYGVVQWIAQNQKDQDFVQVSVPRTPNDRPLLVKAFDESMKALHEKLKESQMEGLPKKEAKLLREMKDLSLLPGKFGIVMNFSSYGLPEPTVKLKCTCVGYVNP